VAAAISHPVAALVVYVVGELVIFGGTPTCGSPILGDVVAWQG
jgi:hypothetical protein